MGKRLWLFLAVCMSAVSMAFAQQTVTGKVIDAQTGEPVIGATVLVQGTTLGRPTDVDGNFSIQNVPSSAKTLKVSYVGMKDQIVNIKPKLRIYLASEATETDEVIVVAYGTATKSSFTGSASVIKAEDIAQQQSSNALEALNGKSAGVQIFNASGQPGQASPTIRVRGITSINAGNAPLIILDGAPYDGDLNTINNADIESMTVLKDAASNALYGARGANGVILITTKRAQYGQNAKITLDAKLGANSRATQRYKTINNPALYYETYFNALQNYAESQGVDNPYVWANENLLSGGNSLRYNIYNTPEGQYLIGTDGKLNPYATMGRVVSYGGEDYYLTADDWLDAAYKHGTRQEYTLTAQNANGGNSFYTSANYLKNEGITHNSNYERFNARLKADSQLKDWLKMGANASFTHYEGKSMSEDGSSSSSGNPIAVASQIAPIYPLYIRDGNGNILRDSNGNVRYDYGDRRNAGLERPMWTGTNALSDIVLDENQYEGNVFNLTGFAEVRFLKDFTFTSTNTVNVDETRATGVTNPFYGTYSSSNGIVSKSHNRSYAYNFQQLLTWAHQFDRHEADVTVGHEAYRYKYFYLNGSKSNMFDPKNDELAGAVTDGSSNSYRTMYNTEGWFARGQYNYDQKYFGSLSLRRDASSRFHNGDWWGTFWSAGGAWIVSKEKWFPHEKAINLLKLKASFGQNGNDNIGSYRYTNTYVILNSNGYPAVNPNAMGNEKIRWEKSSNFNVGLEFELLGSRLNGNIDFFYRKTTDMLFSFPLAPSYGYTSKYANVGDMRNRGVELTLEGDIIRQKDLRWNVNLNLTHYRNKVIYMPEERKTMEVDGVRGFSSGNLFYGEGIELYTFRLKRFAGVDPKNGAQLWYRTASEEVLDADGNVVLDADNNPVMQKVIKTTDDYSKADYYLCGSSLPDLYGGFGTTVEYKGIDFSVNFSYQIGGQVYDSDYAGLMSYPTANSHGGALHADVLKAWSTTNTTSNIPVLMFNDAYAGYSSDRFLTDASYLSLNNITLGYTLPNMITRRLSLDKLRLYVTADNVFVWSKRQGLDPRQSISGGATNAYYAPIRSISGGITLTF